MNAHFQTSWTLKGRFQDGGVLFGNSKNAFPDENVRTCKKRDREIPISSFGRVIRVWSLLDGDIGTCIIADFSVQCISKADPKWTVRSYVS